MSNDTAKVARPGSVIAHREPLVFERSRVGARGSDPWENPFGNDAQAGLDGLMRDDLERFPEVSEPVLVRHYTRISHVNYGIDTGFYPLGSCTMKYNPRVNERVAAMPGYCETHPYAPVEHAQGLLQLMADLEDALAEVGGFAACSLQPAAGAQGELCGLMMIAAYHQANSDGRNVILVPDTAHGTNPSSTSLSGMEVREIKTGAHGYLHLDDIRDYLDERLAGLMVTNPNTLGLYERELTEITAAVHEAGGLVYMDGANLNAQMGYVRPGEIGVDVMHFNLHKTFSTPHGGGGPGAGPVGVSERLEPFLPTPRVVREGKTYRLSNEFPRSIGRLRSFYGNYGMFIRALAYIYTYGGEGLKRVSEQAVLNARYLQVKLQERFHLPYDAPCMHEVVFSDARQRKQGVDATQMAKALMDYGMHPMTVHFPLIVKGAMMIEPTETESRETLDTFIAYMLEIAERVERDAEEVKETPRRTFVRRVDETQAARKPVLCWQPESD